MIQHFYCPECGAGNRAAHLAVDDSRVDGRDTEETTELLCDSCDYERVERLLGGCAGLCCGAMAPTVAQDIQCGLGLPDWCDCEDCLAIDESREQ